MHSDSPAGCSRTVGEKVELRCGLGVGVDADAEQGPVRSSLAALLLISEGAGVTCGFSL